MIIARNFTLSRRASFPLIAAALAGCNMHHVRDEDAVSMTSADKLINDLITTSTSGRCLAQSPICAVLPRRQ